MKTKRDIKFGDQLATDLMPRLRPKVQTINGRKYSSFWFALKAIQNPRILRNNCINGLTTNCLLMSNTTDEGFKKLSIRRSHTSDDNTSNGTPNERIAAKDEGFRVIQVNDKTALVLILNQEFCYELSFGCIRATLLSNNFDIHLNGSTLTANQSIDLMAAFGHRIVIKCQTNGHNETTIDDLTNKLKTLGVEDVESVTAQLTPNSCLLSIDKLSTSSLLYLESVQNFKPLSVKSDTDWFELRSVGTNGLESFKVWDKKSDELKFTPRDVIIVTGGVNVGKSSLIRYFINKYLNQNTENDGNRHCVYLDCDPGQSEFSTAAQLGLTTIQSPALSSTILNVLKHKPVMACSVGSTTPTKNAKLYISSIDRLVNHFKRDMHSKGPLFVNTMGWTRDLGLALLTDIIKIAHPTHVIQMNSTADQSINVGFDLTPQAVYKHNGYLYMASDRKASPKYRLSIIESNNKRSKTSQTTRELQQLSYMSQMPDIAFKPFADMTPYKLLWSNVLVNIVSDYGFAAQLSLDVLNCCWIHLCHFDGKTPRYYLNNGLKIVDSIDGNRCLGSAIIRSIDFENKCFYILSPESREVLDSVNCIVKPSGVWIPEKILLEQLNYSSTSSLPYISTKR